MTKHKNKNQKGFAVLELIFYIALLVVFSTAVINAMLIMTKSFKETAIHADVLQASHIMEKISRETRKSASINAISTSVLRLNTTNDAGASKLVEFSLSESNVLFLENSILTGNLNSSNIVITNLVFSEITTTSGKAVKVSFSVRSTRDSLNRTYDFYDTVVLRESY